MRKTFVVVSILALSSSVYGSEFWANKRGGGADEVLLHNIQLRSDAVVSSSDEPEAVVTEAGFVYEVAAPVDSTLSISMPVDLSDVVIEGSDGAAIETVLDGGDGEGDIKIPAGEWKITLPNRAAKSVHAGSSRTMLGAKKNKQDSEIAPQIALDVSESTYALATDVTERVVRDGKVLYFSAYLTDNITSDDSSDDIAGRVLKGKNSKIIAVVRFPGGKRVKIRLRDNGNSDNRDVASGDGIFSGKVRVSAEGLYKLKFKLKTKHNEAPIKLSTRSTTDVASSRIKIISTDLTATQGLVLDETLEANRYGLRLNVRVVKGKMPEVVNTRAEVWAFDENGNAASIGWIGGMVMPVNDGGARWNVPFTFHAGWLDQGKYTGQITLQNIEISDLDNGDQLVFNNDQHVVVSGISLQSRSSKSSIAKSLSTSPTREMMNGVHPSAFTASKSFEARATNPRDLLFLRGWCTTSALPISQFSSRIRNRALLDWPVPRGQSADQRAVEVMKKLGWRAGVLRGIVAHSQGGLVAASLLDNFSYVFDDNGSSRPPNVVTIGSPFNGTRVGDASNSVTRELSRLVGSPSTCYVPYDLRKSKNYGWRQSIGWRARYQMMAYFTTHTRSRSYNPRNCGPLSYYIRDHDDGVMNFGEGSGFVDGGQHYVKYTGHCHITGEQNYQLRYPPFVNQVNNLFYADKERWQPF